MGSIPAAAHPRLIWGSPTSATQRHSFGSLAALCHPTDVFTSLFHLPEMLGMNVPKLCQKERRLGTDQIDNTVFGKLFLELCGIFAGFQHVPTSSHLEIGCQ